MKEIKTIVFDLYGTLVEIKESKHFFMKLFKSSKDNFGVTISEYLQIVMKNDLENVTRLLTIEFEELYNKNSAELTQELKSVEVYNEVFKVLEELKKSYQIYLISNLAAPYKKPVYEIGLDKYFEKMIFSCEYGFIKPEKEIFKLVEEFSGSAPNEILMIGDSFQSDVTGAKNMNWKFLHLVRQSDVNNNYEIKGLNELERFL